MTQFGAIYPATQNGGIANGREIGAYAIAQAIKLALTFGLSISGLLTPIYLWAYQNGGVVAVVPVTVMISVFWAAVLLILFLALRGALGGVPTMIAEPGREHAVTSRGGEIGAYVIAYAILIAVLTAINGAVLAPVYTSLNHDGRHSAAMTLALVIAFAGAIVVYIVFIGLRAAFCRR
jgi:hypothetical protein